jgi:hypothetical protein
MSGDMPTTRHGSGDHARVEAMTDSFDRVLAKLERLDERFGDLRVDMVGLRNAIDNVRALVDGVHKRALDLEIDHADMSKRVRVLEDAAIEMRTRAEAAAAEIRDVAESTAGKLQSSATRRTAVTVGAAVGGGGVVTAIVEILRAVGVIP